MSEPTGVIHDIGYRHYDGVRQGRGHATAALAVHSLRGVFGIGRTIRAKIIPFMLVGVMMLPTVVSIAVMALAKEHIMRYTEYAVIMQPVLAIFLASQSPYIVAPDLRFRVLPLYLSRPVTLTDYIGAKLAAMATAMFLVLATPLTVMFIGELVVDLPAGPRTADYAAAMAGALCYAVLLSCVGIAIASFTPRRGLGVASIIAFYLLVTSVSTVLFAALESMGDDEAAAWAWMINPFLLVDAAVQVGVFGAKPVSSNIYPPGVGPIAGLIMILLIAGFVAALFARYRKAASR
ncbi:ABC-2 type transport system permease protein [Streptosporangium becharense]|uniref:ABC-2 type transport system permease protein n=1 Tax=Streptosporangium becharense TaxID=1816182 RepID=A0A7W9IF37_9ACTN|nr:ABC transporter permease [Streptosporangium becharense]MBB2909471.1 ABC-2 type transport system permease protein [Streptosporangium becharense]MBB5819572.1 ABC-2 type transport system permease protein [Streptosporangium becharense]